MTIYKRDDYIKIIYKTPIIDEIIKFVNASNKNYNLNFNYNKNIYEIIIKNEIIECNNNLNNFKIEFYKIIKNKIELVRYVTNNFTKILSTIEIKEKYKKELYWGGNGVGNRWANSKLNYSVIFSNNRTKTYSENDNDQIPNNILNNFLQDCSGSGIIGIYVHSIRKNKSYRLIRKDIQTAITSLNCVICGTQNTICDHKNDLYNDKRVINLNTQLIDDFQLLCNHCNLQKRQICKKEIELQKIYSAKNILRYKIYPFEFPWEKKAFDKNDINCKKSTYWYDPVEFDRKIFYYSIYLIPMLNEIKNKIKLIS